MRFVVIEGGRAQDAEARDAPCVGQAVPTVEDVRREADRRLRQAGWDRWRSRNLATGCAIPRELHYMAMQITYVAEALARLATIPDDFRSDTYWPQFTF